MILWNSNETFNDSALIEAARNGYIGIVDLLLRSESIDVNIKNILN